MAFCEECGARLPEGAENCPACGAAAVKRPSPELTQRSAPSGSYTAPRSTDMRLAENEKIVRQYQCTNIKHPRAAGYLVVTNKRMIFQGKGTSSRVVKEVVLDSVSGLDCFYGMNIQLPLLILGALFALGGFYLMNMANQLHTGGGKFLLLVLLGALFIYLSLQKCFFLSVFSSKATGSPICIGGRPQNMLGNGALYSLTSRPTPDTDRMLNELGALVQDLQTLGDHAIEKWNK